MAKTDSTTAMKDEDLESNSEWISITEAAIELRMTYQKARNVAVSGALGEVKRSRRGRYYVRREEVAKVREASNA